MFTTALISAFTLASSTLAAPHVVNTAASSPGSANTSCPIVFDGRVPRSIAETPTYFDSNITNTIFNANFVKGNNLTWSQILKFPCSRPSRFDGSAFHPVEVTISDHSIFNQQKGFRRAGLQFLKDTLTGPESTGVKTLHWSVRQDPERPLNLTHEYLNVWHEAADFGRNQIQFQTGSLIGKSDADKSDFKILDSKGGMLYSVPVDKEQWQNFATTLDYTNNQVTIFYSAGHTPLQRVTGPRALNLTGDGQFQIGMLKKPTGTSDVANSGYQSPGLNEGQIYGGVFLEDSQGGCVSL